MLNDIILKLIGVYQYSFVTFYVLSVISLGRADYCYFVSYSYAENRTIYFYLIYLPNLHVDNYDYSAYIITQNYFYIKFGLKEYFILQNCIAELYYILQNEFLVISIFFIIFALFIEVLLCNIISFKIKKILDKSCVSTFVTGNIVL